MPLRTLRPSGTASSASSARNVSPLPSTCASGSSRSDTSRPSARRKAITSRSCSVGRPGVRRLSTMRRAPRFERQPAGRRAHRAPRSRPARSRPGPRTSRRPAMAPAARGATRAHLHPQRGHPAHRRGVTPFRPPHIDITARIYDNNTEIFSFNTPILRRDHVGYWPWLLVGRLLQLRPLSWGSAG